MVSASFLDFGKVVPYHGHKSKEYNELYFTVVMYCMETKEILGKHAIARIVCVLRLIVGRALKTRECCIT